MEAETSPFRQAVSSTSSCLDLGIIAIGTCNGGESVRAIVPGVLLSLDLPILLGDFVYE